MSKGKYVAYVSAYTSGNQSSCGIRIYDVDMNHGRFTEKDRVEITNSSYVTISHNQKYLYSITDFGVEAYRILKDGTLEAINRASINGMRGCYLSTDKLDRYLFVGGWHDGKVTVMRLNEDGTIGEMTDEVFHKGIGSVAERNFRPHVNCVNITPDQKYLCAVDLGVDQVKIYKFNDETGKITLVDMLRCELESAPRIIKFSPDGRFAYLICELKNYISVYSYKDGPRGPVFELVQTISTLNEYHSKGSAACVLRFSRDWNYVLCSNAGDNSVGIFKIDRETGMLEKICILPVSGDYPKAADFFPDNRHIMALNHESNTMTIFRINYEKKYFSLWGKPLKVETPNCILVSEIEEAPKQ